ncbi:hypothetical protein ACTFIZ_000135 [Dictyostelium cf. discoideum]
MISSKLFKGNNNNKNNFNNNNNKNNNKNKCVAHKDKTIKFLCVDCSSDPVCNSCVVSPKHRGHTFDEIKFENTNSIFEEFKNQLYPKLNECYNLDQVLLKQSNLDFKKIEDEHETNVKLLQGEFNTLQTLLNTILNDGIDQLLTNFDQNQDINKQISLNVERNNILTDHIIKTHKVEEDLILKLQKQRQLQQEQEQEQEKQKQQEQEQEQIPQDQPPQDQPPQDQPPQDQPPQDQDQQPPQPPQDQPQPPQDQPPQDQQPQDQQPQDQPQQDQQPEIIIKNYNIREMFENNEHIELLKDYQQSKILLSEDTNSYRKEILDDYRNSTVTLNQQSIDSIKEMMKSLFTIHSKSINFTKKPKRVQFGDKVFTYYNKDENNGIISTAITHLAIPLNSNIKIIEGGAYIPANVKHCLLLDGFNQPLEPGFLASTITHLHICNIKTPLLVGSIPNGVTDLFLHDGFSQPISQDIIPPSVQNLYLCDIKLPFKTPNSIPSTVASIIKTDTFKHFITPKGNNQPYQSPVLTFLND